MGSREQVIAAAKKYNAPLLAACAETAKRCQATVFVNALDFTPTGERNTTFAFQLFKPYFDKSTVDRAHAAGMRVNVFWSDDPADTPTRA